MKKSILIISLFFFSLSHLFSQSQINIGIGAGQQFGIPGVRIGYKWTKIEGSINYGIIGIIDPRTIPANYSKYEAMHKCIGLGLSFFIKGKFAICYNYGTILFKSSDNYNISTELQNVHTLSLNNDWQFKHVRWRFGYGIGYSNEYESYTGKFYPVLTLGCIFKIWQKKADY
jgi:hypothetical protein